MISAQQREARRNYIGSSDAPAILGLDPYRSASDVWLEKTGQVDDFEGNNDTRRGTFLEPAILDWAAWKLGQQFKRNVMGCDHQLAIAANFDGINGDGGFIVEAKSSVNADEWGEEGTDQVPERVVAQTHHAMLVAGRGIRTAYVPVLLPGFRSFDFRLYKIERNDDLAAEIGRRGAAFMVDYVRPKIRPDDFKPSIEVLKRIRRELGKVTTVESEVADTWIIARAARLKAEKFEEEAERALLAAIGDAEAADHPGGRITYLEQFRNSLDAKALEAAHPEIAKQFRKFTSYRVLRHKAAKESK